MKTPRNEREAHDDITESIFSKSPRPWRPSDGYLEPHRGETTWLLVGVFLSGVVCGVALSIAVNYL